MKVGSHFKDFPGKTKFFFLHIPRYQSARLDQKQVQYVLPISIFSLKLQSSKIVKIANMSKFKN